MTKSVEVAVSTALGHVKKHHASAIFTRHKIAIRRNVVGVIGKRLENAQRDAPEGHKCHPEHVAGETV